MNRKCVRCGKLENFEELRWSKVFKGFVHINKEICKKEWRGE